MRRPKRPRLHGFVLIEVMLALMLLAVFGLISSQVIITSLKMMAQTDEQHNQIMRFDRAVGALRRDAWSARQMASSDPHTLSIVNGEGKITWTLDNNAWVRTADGQKPQRWDLEAKPSFAVDGPTLTVTVQEAGNRSGQIQMISPMLVTPEAH